MYLPKITILLIFISGICTSQRLDQLGKAKPLTFTGGIAANTIFHEGTANREPFTYFLTGTLNANVYGLYNIPVSFSYTNQQFTFNEPSFKINRLSLHPSYKWITTHIGDVAMTFSPYTLNGHQFTGFGIELTPNGPLKFSAMYGRLVRNREYDAKVPEALPSYKRMGYGVRLSFDKPKYGLGATFFRAKDQVNSVQDPIPEDLGITPEENLVISLEGTVKLFEKAQIHAEFAQSALTHDLRDPVTDNNAILASFMDTRTSTSFHNALNVNLSYIVANGTLGVGYERIDPEYQTLGAYYFNNDLENITAKISQTLFKNKLYVNLNAGLQRDDLNHQKQSKLSRLVTALNMNYRPNDQLTLNGSYSNFKAYTQIKNQFDYINEVRPYDNLDTLNFTQISRNASLNINYLFSKKESVRHALNLNTSYQNTDEKQDGFLVEVAGNNSKFINGNLAYTLTFTEQHLSLMGAFSSMYNTLADVKTTIMGPTVGIVKQFFDKKMQTRFSSSYNTTVTGGVKQGDVLNFRVGGGYVYRERHNFNFNLISLFRKSINRDKVNDFTATLGYTYNFTNRRKQRVITKIDETDQTQKKDAKIGKIPEVEINYKGYRYSGTPGVITRKLGTLKDSDVFTFLDAKTLEKIDKGFEKIKIAEEGKPRDYKNAVYEYLDIFAGLNAELEEYQELVKEVLRDLAKDIVAAHDELEKEYIKAKTEFDASPVTDTDQTANEKTYADARTRFIHHSYIYRQLQKPEQEVLNKIHIYKGSMLGEISDMRLNKDQEEQIAAQLKMALIAYFDEQATLHATDEDIILLKTN